MSNVEKVEISIITIVMSIAFRYILPAIYEGGFKFFKSNIKYNELHIAIWNIGEKVMLFLMLVSIILLINGLPSVNFRLKTGINDQIVLFLIIPIWFNAREGTKQAIGIIENVNFNRNI